MTRARPGSAALLLLLAAGSLPAQENGQPRVKEPARAEKLDVTIRYRLRAERDDRVRQFLLMEKHLAALGFVDAKKDDLDRDLVILDTTNEYFRGTIPSAKVLNLLDDPRIQTILFAPAGFEYPDSPEKPVAVRLSLRGGLLPTQQEQFHLQVLAQLERLGFRENTGYDTRGYTLLRGSIPYKYLDRLVKDLRAEPAGWFLPGTTPDRLPRPFADRNPVRWVEVLPVTEFPPPYIPPPLLPIQNRLTPDLRAVLANPDLKETPTRVVVLFAEAIDDRVETLRSRLIAAYGPTLKRTLDGTLIKGPDGLPALTDGAALDGVVGNLASIRFDRPSDAERFAGEPGVLGVRLPRPATETTTPLAVGKPAAVSDVLKGSGVAVLHSVGYTGGGVKVILIGSDFTGAEKLIGTALPKKTRVVDMTAELEPEIVPLPADPTREGAGLAAAKALAVAAPDAELVLVRVDPGAIFQLFGIIRLARGDAAYSDAMRSRLTEITTRAGEVSRRKDLAAAEYRAAFEDLADDIPTKNRRERAQAALNAVIAEQNQLTRRINRFTAFQQEVTAALAGAQVFVNTLVWESGYPLDSVSYLSRALEQLANPQQPRVVKRQGDPASAPKPPVVWVQASSASGVAVWGGPFLDANRDGVMEFARPDQPLPAPNWSPELNFLGFQAADGAVAPALPAMTRLRLTMQWRESLDPNFPNPERPAYPVVLRVFRQLDPDGEKLASDELAEAVRSVGGPYPISLSKTDVVFEQILDFTVPADGRYALMVALGYQPDPLLPTLRREIEVYPRLYAETLSGKPGDGRVVFRSYVNAAAGVGIPGDSAGAITVGVPVAGELYGGGTGLTLRAKPDIFGPETLDVGGPAARGPGIATGYLGGLAATLVQAGAAGPNVFRSAGFAPGKMAVVPPAWVQYLRPIRRPEK